jgi:hypothetical protein
MERLIKTTEDLVDELGNESIKNSLVRLRLQPGSLVRKHGSREAAGVILLSRVLNAPLGRGEEYSVELLEDALNRASNILNKAGYNGKEVIEMASYITTPFNSFFNSEDGEVVPGREPLPNSEFKESIESLAKELGLKEFAVKQDSLSQWQRKEEKALKEAKRSRKAWKKALKAEKKALEAYLGGDED